jgi:hypothetical protein
MLPDLNVWMLLLAHSLLSLLAGLISTLLMPPQYRSSPRRTFTHHSVVSFFIPVLGALALILLALYARAINLLHQERPYTTIRLPVFTAAPAAPALAYGAGSIRSRLINTDLPQETRLKALMAVQAMPGNLSTRLLHEVLSDPSDDLRLTAYGMLDKGEKRINLQIQHALDELAKNSSPEQRGQLLKQLASHYWELVYQDYAHQGELREFALQSAWRYTQEALSQRPDDGELWVMAGRIALARLDTEQAMQAFSQADRLAVPAGRVQPYLAELAFQRRDFRTVRELVARFGKQEASFSTTPVLAFWKNGARS